MISSGETSPSGPRRARKALDESRERGAPDDNKALLKHWGGDPAIETDPVLRGRAKQYILGCVADRMGQEALADQQAILLDINIEIGVAA